MFNIFYFWSDKHDPGQLLIRCIDDEHSCLLQLSSGQLFSLVTGIELKNNNKWAPNEQNDFETSNWASAPRIFTWNRLDETLTWTDELSPAGPDGFGGMLKFPFFAWRCLRVCEVITVRTFWKTTQILSRCPEKVQESWNGSVQTK